MVFIILPLHDMGIYRDNSTPKYSNGCIGCYCGCVELYTGSDENKSI